MPSEPLPDLWSLYRLMRKCRQYELAVAHLWEEGRISGEMHLGTGEEAIIAGVVSQLQPGDAMALDHRGTAAMLARGVDPLLLLREMLACPDGLCGGRGGHMHLFSKEHLAASSGIVGAAGPAACGFALAARVRHPGAIALAFFGEGAMNQGMLLESLNLAAVWKLPVVFVCKDDQWAVTTRISDSTSGSLVERARGFGLPALDVDGLDVLKVWSAAHQAIQRARLGDGPTFLHARCIHLEGHFLGYQLLRALRHPLREMPPLFVALLQSLFRRGGASVPERLAGMRMVNQVMADTLRDPRRDPANDPLLRLRSALSSDPQRLSAIESSVEQEIDLIMSSVLQAV